MKNRTKVAIVVFAVGSFLFLPIIIETFLLSKEPIQERLSMVHINKRIVFAHNSVGANILDGIPNAVDSHYSQPVLKIFRNSLDWLHKPGIYSYRIGYNDDPFTKLQVFEDLLRDHGNKIDIAIFKFCYVDMRPDTDVTAFFEHYTTVMDRIARNHPTITIVHTTMPLSGRNTKQVLKSFISKTGDTLHVKREEYNNLIRKHYGSLVFDIAAFESNYNTANFTFKGNKYPILYEKYTYDGGHLNTVGSTVLAKAFLIFLQALQASL